MVFVFTIINILLYLTLLLCPKGLKRASTSIFPYQIISTIVFRDLRQVGYSIRLPAYDTLETSCMSAGCYGYHVT